MKVSLTPSWFHKSSAALTLAIASIAGWDWTTMTDAATAGKIVSALALAKLLIEFFSKDARTSPNSESTDGTRIG